ncbi:phytoene/squalene synthase family protein [Patescibacteria group bacterium]|nr:phytoene/squalene synthase family protein [Patescibacteria group bacterium]
MDPSLERAFQVCERIHAKHGKSYYFATRFFPREKRLATFALYAFFRIPDEIVDTDNASKIEAHQQLIAWKEKWRQAYQQERSDDSVLHAAAWTFHTYKIPFAYSEAFLDAMIMDTEKATYANYQELEKYMYGSAGVVGLMMSYVIGFSDPIALPYAEKLGYAMQLTNFLRDIAEDWDLRERIYMPQDDMRRFQVTSSQIREHRFDENIRELIRFEVARADVLYEEAERGIALLHKDGRFAVRVAGALYREILRKIEVQEYNIFRGRARTSFLEKVRITARCARLSFNK